MTSSQTSGFPDYGIPTAIEALALDRQSQLLDEAGRRRLVGAARRHGPVPPWRLALGHGLLRLGQRVVGSGHDAASGGGGAGRLAGAGPGRFGTSVG